MSQIFISYSRRDRDYALKLSGLLRQNNLPVWIDDRIDVGEEWTQAIVDSIKASKIIIVLVTAHAESSEWVRREVLIAQRFRKIIFPLLLRDEELSLLINVQHYDLRDYRLPSQKFYQRLAEIMAKKTAPIGAGGGGSNAAIQQTQELPKTGPLKERPTTLRHSLESIFDSLGYEYYVGGDLIEEGEAALQTRFQKIHMARFCIFELTDEPDTYVELGMALALNRYCLVFAKVGVKIADFLDGYNVVRYAAAAEFEEKLKTAAEQLKLTAVQNYCHFCRRLCEGMSTHQDMNAYLILDNTRLLWRDLVTEMTQHIAQRHAYPIRLTDAARGHRLCDLRTKVLRGQFAVAHLGRFSSYNSMLALGMAIGSLVPWAVIYNPQTDTIPPILQGIRHTSPAIDVNERLEEMDKLLNIVMPVSSEQITVHTLQLATETFWSEMDDWVQSVTRNPETHEPILGTIRVIRYEGKRYSQKYYLNPKTQRLKFGRDAKCDVTLEHPLASGEHFQIMQGTNQRYYLIDLGSTNGTFLNGRKLAQHKQQEIFFSDEIRVAGAHFRIWDERQLPENTKPVPQAEPLIQTDEVGRDVIRIDFPDVPPPEGFDAWDHKIILRTLLPDGKRNSVFEVQAYYPLGRVLAELALVLQLPNLTHYFVKDNLIVNPEETPMELGLKDGDTLRITIDRVEWAVEETRKRIYSCDSKACQGDEKGREWKFGEQFGTLRALFEDTFRREYSSEPPSQANIPPIKCPRCSSVIKENNVVGV